MIEIMDKVHTVGMAEFGSTYLSVRAYYDKTNRRIPIEPPLQINLEGEEAQVAFVQGALAARYQDEELRTIGDGNSMLGMRRVVSAIAVNGGLHHDAVKPLHPDIVDGHADAITGFIGTQELRLEMTA